MSFCAKSLARVGHQVTVGSTAGAAQSQQVTDLRYATDDAAAVVEAAGYWNNARNFVKKGDVVTSIMAHSGTPILKTYVFTSVPATGNVVAALQTTTAG